MTATNEISPIVARLVDQIVEDFGPRRVVLFGSHARGAADGGSDVDLLVVLNGDQPVMRRAKEIYRSLDHDVPVDILVRTPAQVAERNPRDLILRTRLAEGLTVYESRD